MDGGYVDSLTWLESWTKGLTCPVRDSLLSLPSSLFTFSWPYSPSFSTVFSVPAQHSSSQALSFFTLQSKPSVPASSAALHFYVPFQLYLPSFKREQLCLPQPPWNRLPTLFSKQSKLPVIREPSSGELLRTSQERKTTPLLLEPSRVSQAN